ncbi:unnamed protein product [Polarella glacialis]|uniref:Uncharacterized protein n=1 Tax=Polarella glacialis TaxID=89957 RepID=A0A813DJZ1_POLGL|nr:unnamed protein product [Polarella glacialis]
MAVIKSRTTHQQVLLCGILAQVGLVEAAKADAYCSLFVCVFVLSATASLLKTLIKRSNPLAYATIEEEGSAGAKELSQQAGCSASEAVVAPSATCLGLPADQSQL